MWGRRELIEKWLKEDKLECTEELGDIVRPLETKCPVRVLGLLYPNKWYFRFLPVFVPSLSLSFSESKIVEVPFSRIEQVEESGC